MRISRLRESAEDLSNLRVLFLGCTVFIQASESIAVTVIIIRIDAILILFYSTPSNPFPLLRHRGSEMPSVTVLPPSPPTAFPSSSSSASSSLYGFFLSSHPYSSFHSDQLNGAPRPFEDMSVAEIKERAIQQAQRASRGSSAISLIRSAKGQISLAQSCESAGDFKGALSAFTKAASLTQVFMDTADFKAESGLGKRGVLWKEFTEFQQVSRSPLSPHL